MNFSNATLGSCARRQRTEPPGSVWGLSVGCTQVAFVSSTTPNCDGFRRPLDTLRILYILKTHSSLPAWAEH